MSAANKLVSIITPCYNGEDYLDRFFQNILQQTYPNIELLFVNDGSHDRTEEIAKKYVSKFEQAGKVLRYFYQENAGQAAAMNQGLPVFRGDYLMWTDADDILAPENVARKVEYLESHLDVGIVMCRGRKVKEGDLQTKVDEYYRCPPQGEDHFFEDLLVSKNVVFTPGIYMVRREIIKKAFPEGKILESWIGQNFQMLLPVAYIAVPGYIHEDLFSYVIRETSHSNQINSLEKVLRRDREHERVVLQLLDMINPVEKEKYVAMVRQKYMRTQMDAAYLFKDKKLLVEKYQQLKKNGYAQKRDTLICLAGRFKIVDFFYGVFKIVKKTNYQKKAKKS